MILRPIKIISLTNPPRKKNFKIGDKVKITENNRGNNWYSPEIFTIKAFHQEKDLVYLNSNLNYEFKDNTIHIEFIRKVTKKELNEERKNKLNKLNELK